MLTILTLASLLCVDARAASNELSVEIGSLGTRDERFELFHERNLLSTWGLRGGVAVHPRVAILAGWHHATAGNAVEMETLTGSSGYTGDDEYYYDEEGLGAFQAAYRGEHFTLGPKVDLPIDDWGFPYLTVQGALFVGKVLLDEDATDETNLNQLKGTAFSPGGLAAAGIDIVPVHLAHGKLDLGGHLELGYATTLDTTYRGELPTGTGLTQAELARFGLGGFYLRAGVGVYF